MPDLSKRLEAVHADIGAAAKKSGRDASAVTLIAVSKTHPPETIHEALDAGQILFGESRVQEARAKIPLLPARARWHFIGHLQKNKVRPALPLFELFHGIDSLPIASDLNRIAEEFGARPKVLLEINVAGEASKFGFSPDGIRRDLEELLALNRVQIEGLMTIAPLAQEAEHARQFFAALRKLRDDLQTEFGIALPQLSMGMSHDFVIAIEEGATLVRVGTAIFGARGKTFRPLPEELS